MDEREKRRSIDLNNDGVQNICHGNFVRAIENLLESLSSVNAQQDAGRIGIHPMPECNLDLLMVNRVSGSLPQDLDGEHRGKDHGTDNGGEEEAGENRGNQPAKGPPRDRIDRSCKL